MAYKPYVTEDIAVSLAGEIFNIVVDHSPSSVKEFPSYDDRNFYLRGRRDLTNDEDHLQSESTFDEFVLKITNSDDSAVQGLVEETNAMMIHMNKNGIPCPIPLLTASGKLYEMRQFYNTTEVATDGNDAPTGPTTAKRSKSEPKLFNYAVRLLTFIPGTTMREAECDNDLFYKVGCFSAEVDKVLKGFKCPLLQERDFSWDLKSLNAAIRVSSNIKDAERKKILDRIEKTYKINLEPKFNMLPEQCIHGDINDSNLLLKHGSTNQFEICGLIDFGDVNYSCRVFEVAIAATYMAVIASGDPVEAAAHAVAGYQQVNPLTEIENELIFNLIEARLYQSICFGVVGFINEPDNADYLLYTTERAWNVLDKLAAILPTEFDERWQKLIKS